ncbi:MULTISPECIES: nitroreductase family deazaflavin-dependent oxidoreductase [unclassified Streptomyces]|uniref:nitroreductase family deazaflavin-dependent oxidoreductase n=1 Tax=unclassified Streptomyces TaxID=2593676 RepID=UPI0022550530|nr:MULTISPECIES: nitroreductase family deazaflavin-dependent oxidoreductase [unclassified Streptomyces]MCX5141349.1 nitroreductase family deazaflavin-dependent oxidoreductase [Streptomyces sp. NBC_00338]WRZ69932.1 nitroreductase family deazaflavin-dependent oxidoreductase [Streptomyces sp. NBC_01257]WSU63797.1 nitroreductase family deazaflavin-dependent oxidoreductase [Streptomyces sp. NBC_01104]
MHESGPSPAPQRPPLPTGLRRAAFRLPLHMFRAGLGPLFRGRLLLLVHTGRTSGLPRRTVIEVVESAPVDGRRSWTVASGFGPGADWYRNLRRTPQATVQAGRAFHAVTAHVLPAEEGGELMARYAPRHPRTARRLCAYMGFTVDGSTQDYRRVGESLPFVRLVEGTGPGGGRRETGR